MLSEHEEKLGYHLYQNSGAIWIFMFSAISKTILLYVVVAIRPIPPGRCKGVMLYFSQPLLKCLLLPLLIEDEEL